MCRSPLIILNTCNKEENKASIITLAPFDEPGRVKIKDFLLTPAIPLERIECGHDCQVTTYLNMTNGEYKKATQGKMKCNTNWEPRLI